MSKPEMEFYMIDMIYVALPMGAQTEKTTFSCKDDKGEFYMYIEVVLFQNHFTLSKWPNKELLLILYFQISFGLVLKNL